MEAKPSHETNTNGEPMTLAGKTFRAIANSSNGTISTDTTMTFVSDDERGILGVYSGGTIKTGQVVARRKDACTVEMLYQCVTVSHELKAGRALGHFSHRPDHTLCMRLDWQWLTGDRSGGVSEWLLERAPPKG